MVVPGKRPNINWEKLAVVVVVLFQIFGVEPRLDSLEGRLGGFETKLAGFETKLAAAISSLATATTDIADLTAIRSDLVQDIEKAVRRAEGRGVEEGVRLICRHPDADDIPICQRRT